MQVHHGKFPGNKGQHRVRHRAGAGTPPLERQNSVNLRNRCWRDLLMRAACGRGFHLPMTGTDGGEIAGPATMCAVQHDCRLVKKYFLNKNIPIMTNRKAEVFLYNVYFKLFNPPIHQVISKIITISVPSMVLQ